MKQPKLKPGDSVWRVMDDPEGGWYLTSVKVKSASDRQIALVRPFPFFGRTRFPPSSLGIVFHMTEEAAIAHFVKQAEAQIAAANRKIIEASKAMAWARSTLVHLEALDDRTGGQG